MSFIILSSIIFILVSTLTYRVFFHDSEEHYNQVRKWQEAMKGMRDRQEKK